GRAGWPQVPSANPCVAPGRPRLRPRLQRAPAPRPPAVLLAATSARSARRSPPGRRKRRRSCGRHISRCFRKDAVELAFPNPRKILLVLEQRAERGLYRGRIELGAIERDDRVAPVDGLGDSGILEQ